MTEQKKNKNNLLADEFATLDNIDAIVLVSNAEGNIVFANKAVKRILGFEPHEVLGNGWWELTANEYNLSKRKITIAALATGNMDLKDRHLFENPIRTKDGRIVWTQWTNTRTKDGLLIGLAQDITTKKELEQALIRKNGENELLLKEIHHRVKNNLQIITSLLNLQFSNFDNPHVTDALDKSKDRINSMALIHTKLYQSGNHSTIQFGVYIHELATSIADSYNINNNVKWLVKHGNDVFDIDLALNLGLIITELLTNAYKHAFENIDNGLIKIELSTLTNHKHQLIIEDNGTGTKNAVILDDPVSLGLEIVKALVEQINGEIKIEFNKGIKYTVTFEK